jgi:hypothetical protein
LITSASSSIPMRWKQDYPQTRRTASSPKSTDYSSRSQASRGATYNRFSLLADPAYVTCSICHGIAHAKTQPLTLAARRDLNWWKTLLPLLHEVSRISSHCYFISPWERVFPRRNVFTDRARSTSINLRSTISMISSRVSPWERLGMSFPRGNIFTDRARSTSINLRSARLSSCTR